MATGLGSTQAGVVLLATIALWCVSSICAIPSLELAPVIRPALAPGSLHSGIEQTGNLQLRGGNAASQPIIEKFVTEMLDQTEQLLEQAENESLVSENVTVEELSPAVEQLLTEEIHQLVLQEKENGRSNVTKNGIDEKEDGAVFMQRAPASKKVVVVNVSEASTSPSHQNTAKSQTVEPPKSSFVVEWLLPKIIPGLGLLLVSSMVLALVDGTLVSVVKSHMENGLGLQPLLALAREKRTREIVRPLMFIMGGYIFSNWLGFAAQRHMLDFLMVDETTALFLQGFVKWGSLAVASSVIIHALGYTTAGLDTLLASSGVAIAVASQTVLKNFAAGLIILLFRPFQVGDRIRVGDVVGTVTGMGILETQVITDAGVRIAYSNGNIKENFLENLTAHGMRRVEIPITVSVDADAVATRKALEEAIEPWLELWKQKPSRPGGPAAHAPAHAPRKQKSISELVLGRSTAELITSKYQEALKVLDRDGDGTISASEILGALSGDLLKRIAGEVQSGPKFAKAQRGYVICVGGTELGVKWFAHVWAPSHDHDPVFVGVSEAMVKALQERGLKIAARAK